MSLQQLFPQAANVDPESAYGDLRLQELASPDRPYAVANMVSSADGKATLSGKSGGLSNQVDRRLFHLLRAQVDAVMAGTTTIEKEKYGPLVRDRALRERRRQLGLEPIPYLVTATRTMSLPVDAPLFQDAETRAIVITNSEREPPDCPAQLLIIRTAGKTIEFRDAFRELRSKYGIRSMLVEGGPTLLGTLIAMGQIDELFLTISPLIAGGGPGPTIVEGPPPPEPRQLELKSVLSDSGSLFLRYGLVSA